MDKSFVFVDIETNGGSCERGRVIEVAAIKVQGGEIIESFQSLVNPGTAIPTDHDSLGSFVQRFVTKRLRSSADAARQQHEA